MTDFHFNDDQVQALRPEIDYIVNLFFQDEPDIQASDMLIGNEACIFDVTPIYLKRTEIEKILRERFGEAFNFDLSKPLVEMVFYIKRSIGWPEVHRHH